MKQRLIAISLALLLPIAACKSSAPPPSPSTAQTSSIGPQLPTGSGFDFYLLNLSWSPEFCYSHPSATECAAHAAFVLHGLWPQNTNGTYPESCSTAPGPADPGQFKDIYPDPGLLQHEWQTHGTCSSLSADAFFQTARSAVRSITIPPTLATLTSQTSLPPNQIVALFTASNPSIPPESFAVSCGHNYLTAIEVCLDKSLHPIPCNSIRSCRANTVRIPPP
ncbi:MAG: ribonuclease T [Terracidiphilus sp.]